MYYCIMIIHQRITTTSPHMPNIAKPQTELTDQMCFVPKNWLGLSTAPLCHWQGLRHSLKLLQQPFDELATSRVALAIAVSPKP
jgi:hypothetical protein